MAAPVVIPQYGVAHRARWRVYLRRTLKLLVVIALLAAIGAALWWYAVVRPYQHLARLLAPGQLATPAELRDAAHGVVRLPFGDSHDAYLVLIKHGDASSVPLLIRSLRFLPHTAPGGGMICTKAHCLEALRKLTGVDRGKNYADWASMLDAQPTSKPA